MFSNSATAAADKGRRAFLSALLALLALPLDLAVRTPDPVFAAIETARQAREDFTVALDALDRGERGKRLLRAADKAAERDTAARSTLARTKPETLAGLHALIRHHAEDIALLEPGTVGATALRDVAQALPPAPIAATNPPRSLAFRMGRIAAEGVIAVMVTGSGATLVALRHLI